jgi:hypothetical protein
MYVIRTIFPVTGGLLPSGTFYLHETLFGFIAQLFTDLGAELKIW